MAIRNGFGRATTTIVDANLTTLITATVLYVIGTDQIKGFAVTLWLGVVLSMFTAIFCSRVVFDIAEKQRWITKLKMMRILGGHEDRFPRQAAAGRRRVDRGDRDRPGCGVVGRGTGLLDIDFTGGVSVETVFTTKPNRTSPRSAASWATRARGSRTWRSADVQTLDDPVEGLRFIDQHVQAPATWATDARPEQVLAGVEAAHQERLRPGVSPLRDASTPVAGEFRRGTGVRRPDEAGSPAAARGVDRTSRLRPEAKRSSRPSRRVRSSNSGIGSTTRS